MTTYDAIVVGAGVNGLSAAALLARGGLKVLALERGERVGGTAVVEEFYTGFRANVCRDDAGWIPPKMARDLRLPIQGLQLRTAPVGLVAPRPNGPPLALWPDVARTVAGLRDAAPRDAERWADFCALVTRVTKVLAALYGQRPPSVQSRAAGDLLALAALGRRLRASGRREMMEVLRAVPMPVADLVSEWVGEPALAGALAACGIRDVQHGPLSSGTALVFFHHHVGLPEGAIGVRRTALSSGGGRDSTGALADALLGAARAAGAEVRTNAAVTQVLVRDGVAAGVALASGEECRARLVVSSADPQQTFSLVDSQWLDVAFHDAVGNVRTRGSSARVHFALDGLPSFSDGARAWDAELLTGTIVIHAGVMGIERAYDDAKYGYMPAEPALTVTIPSLVDPGFAPAGRHVLSVTVHHAPYALRGGWGNAEREALGDLVEMQLSRIAWDFRDRVLHRWVLTPVDLGNRFSLSGGSLTHGEVALDQLLFMRPVPQCARYATPLPGLWLCGAGTHPASTSGACGMLAAQEILRSR